MSLVLGQCCTLLQGVLFLTGSKSQGCLLFTFCTTKLFSKFCIQFWRDLFNNFMVIFSLSLSLYIYIYFFFFLQCLNSFPCSLLSIKHMLYFFLYKVRKIDQWKKPDMFSSRTEYTMCILSISSCFVSGPLNINSLKVMSL